MGGEEETESFIVPKAVQRPCLFTEHLKLLLFAILITKLNLPRTIKITNDKDKRQIILRSIVLIGEVFSSLS